MEKWVPVVTHFSLLISVSRTPPYTHTILCQLVECCKRMSERRRMISVTLVAKMRMCECASTSMIRGVVLVCDRAFSWHKIHVLRRSSSVYQYYRWNLFSNCCRSFATITASNSISQINVYESGVCEWGDEEEKMWKILQLFHSNGIFSMRKRTRHCVKYGVEWSGIVFCIVG